MPVTKLRDALTAVNWNGSVAAFLAGAKSPELLAKKNLRIAVWALQFETVDRGNAALCFVREMQVAGQHVAALVALSLYKPAASSMRTMFEAGLYYSYFRTHPSELETLVRDASYFVDKKGLLEYHKHHTANFVELQRSLGLISRLEIWYNQVSAVIHGQIPGAWIEHKSLAQVGPITKNEELATACFAEGEEILHRLFLCTVGRARWNHFSSSAKKELLRGLDGAQRSTLGLDSA